VLSLMIGLMAAPMASDGPRFRACSAVARTRPERAILIANGWRIEGGGAAARHCLALAQFQKGEHDAALESFEAAARLAAGGRDGAEAAVLLYLAGTNAALLAERPAVALRLAGDGLALTPPRAQAAKLGLLKGEALVALEREADGLAAIEAALAADAEVANGWLLKATLLRRLGRLEEAERAILEAGRRAADGSEAAADVQLEAGAIAFAQGRKDLARAAWTAAAAGEPEWPASVAARAALARD
jgi:tetratricopeptide (TPR) repeat protein